MSAVEDQRNKRSRGRLRSAIAVGILSFLVCGLLFPLLITGLGQLVFPHQAQGSLARFQGRTVGSFVAVNSTDYSSPAFFHLRNDSASGFDPDITLQDALSQVPRVSNATGIPAATLQSVVDQHIEGVWWVFGSPYVNVQRLNLLLLQEFPSAYSSYSN